jgi:hypothetical protein
MTNVNFHLLVRLLFRIHPKVGERWFEKASADAVEIGHIIPFLLTRVEHFVKIRPSRHIGLHEENIILPRGEFVEISCCAKIRDQNSCAEIVRLLCECETDTYEVLVTWNRTFMLIIWLGELYRTLRL